MKAQTFNKTKASKKEIAMGEFFELKDNANEIKEIAIDFINTLYPNARIYKQSINAVTSNPYLLVFDGKTELNVYSLDNLIIVWSLNKRDYKTKYYIYSL